MSLTFLFPLIKAVERKDKRLINKVVKQRHLLYDPQQPFFKGISSKGTEFVRKKGNFWESSTGANQLSLVAKGTRIIHFYENSKLLLNNFKFSVHKFNQKIWECFYFILLANERGISEIINL